MAAQGAVIHWVAHHRKHHTFADEDGDPHSPHTSGVPGWRGVVRGMWHAHIGWMLDPCQHASARRFAPDLKRDATISFIDRRFLAWVLLGLATPFIAGYATSGGRLHGALTGLLWGGLVRIFLFHHATWSVNSICHFTGGARSRRGIRAATTGRSQSSPLAKAGTKTTMPSRPQPATDYCAVSWTLATS